MKPKIAIIGGGASGLFFAANINCDNYEVDIFEKNQAIGRKLLVAGKGGFNLSHSEPTEQLTQRYTPVSFLNHALIKFDNQYLREWLMQLDVPTYIGSSKRIFPVKGIKPIEVVNAVRDRILKNGVKINYNNEWLGFDNQQRLIIKDENNTASYSFDYVIFALGGGSWKITGSTGDWLNKFPLINTHPFIPSNCAYKVNWPKQFIETTEGLPLKNIAVSIGNKTIKGEIMITEFGLEGNAIYPCSPEIRQLLLAKTKALIHIDLKPSLSISELESKLSSKSNVNWTSHIKAQLKLSKAQLNLLKAYTSKETFQSPILLSKSIKAIEIELLDFADLDEAISTVGGIDLTEVDENFQLLKRPNHYVIGEMLDWDAPTGGYLLQACFSMGHYLADYFNHK